MTRLQIAILKTMIAHPTYQVVPVATAISDLIDLGMVEPYRDDKGATRHRVTQAGRAAV